MMQRLLLFILAFSYACSPSTKEENTTAETSSTIEIEYAENFLIKQEKDQFLIEIVNPDTHEVDESFTVKTADENRKIIGLTATLNGMLSVLSSNDLLVGISSADYVFDQTIKTRVKEGRIAEFGDESSYSVEKILASKANTIFYSGFGDDFPNRNKLEKFGFTILPIYDWRENHPLGKAEWIKLVGVLIGKEKEANSYFDKIKQEYEKIANLAAKQENNPSVISGNLIGDIWYAPGGNSYMAKMMKDAGGNYIYAETEETGSTERSIEQILTDNKTTEVWINPGSPTLKTIDQFNPHAKHLKAHSNIYCYSPNMNKFWERSAIEPHLILSDLIHIFHPEITEISDFHFYQKID